MEKQVKKKAGKLYLCATPIGNLEDITLRVLRILREVDLIAAEDTRRTRKLLSHYEIRRPLSSFNQANEKKVLPGLINKLKQGTNIALVSDAGTPGIADPGHSLVNACLNAGIDYELLPGPSAAVSAAVISGLPTSDLRFLGFLPRRSGRRRRLLESLVDQPSTLIFYEAPHRLAATLSDIQDSYGSRSVVIVREMTKKFEERLTGTAKEIIETIIERTIKGEIVILIKGSEIKGELLGADEITGQIKELIDAGISRSEAARIISEKLKLPKRYVYNLAVKVKK